MISEVYICRIENFFLGISEVGGGKKRWWQTPKPHWRTKPRSTGSQIWQIGANLRDRQQLPLVLDPSPANFRLPHTHWRKVPRSMQWNTFRQNISTQPVFCHGAIKIVVTLFVSFHSNICDDFKKELDCTLYVHGVYICVKF